MIKNYKLIIVVLLFTSVCSVYSFFYEANKKDTVRVADFPTHIANWTSENIPIPANDLAILETDNAFVRKYLGPQGEVVYLYLVYSQHNRKVVHPPEICYTGGGVSVVDKKKMVLTIDQKSFNSNFMVLKGKNIEQCVFYWFKLGDIFTESYLYQQLLTIGNTLLGRQQGGALIRVSVDIQSQDIVSAQQHALEFIKVLAPTLKQYLP